MTDYSDILELHNLCNYIDPETSNAQDSLLSCIKKPEKKNPLSDGYCLNLGIEMLDEDTIEGFSNDHSSLGSGVSYVPRGFCHDGQIRDENLNCIYQEYRGRERDGNWNRGHFSEIMHKDKELYKLCENGKFLGISNGYMICEKNQEDEIKEKVIEGFSIKVKADFEEVNAYQTI
jgi:hypothetical protein